MYVRVLGIKVRPATHVALIVFGICFGLCSFSALSAWLEGKFTKSASSRFMMSCVFNQEELGKAANMYAADWDDHFPGPKWQIALRSKLPPIAFDEPAFSYTAERRFGYAYHEGEQ